MKHVMIACALAFFAGAGWADPLEGVWQTEPDDGSYAHITIAPCGDKYCGVISRSYDSAGQEFASANKGKQLVIDMEAQGGGRYRGQVWRPSNDKIYLGKMDLKGDTVKLRGCVAGGLLCSSQTWQRVR